MSKDLRTCFSKKLFTTIPMFFILAVLFLLPDNAWSQKKQLTASGKVIKIAFIDHSRLRKEFKKFVAAKEKLAKENEAEKKSLEQALRFLDKQTKEQLVQDSLNGGGTRNQITSKANSKRSGIIHNNQLSQRKRNQARIALTQDYERKINTAVETVVREGGFTEVKPFVKDSSGQSRRNVDVTDLLLRKLN